MKISNKGLELIKEFEGCELNAYRCPSNVLTIGWGHTENVYEGQSITQEEADNILISDMVKYENYVNGCNNLSFTPNQNQFDALVSFTYNCGQGSLSTLVNNRNAEEVSNAILLYNRGSNGVLPGLVRRREAEKALFLNGEFDYTPVEQSTTSVSSGSTSRGYITIGSNGSNVAELQSNLNALGFNAGSVDGNFGPKTKEAVTEFQSAIGINSDGLAGSITLEAIKEILSKPLDGVTYQHYEYATRYIQYRVGAKVDGVFGKVTECYVKIWQSNHSLTPDGVVGKNTWSSMI